MSGLSIDAAIRERFELALAALGSLNDPIGLAVSGGPDSMALALLAADWAQARKIDLVALIVDHQLRPESALEAATAANWCQALGIRAQILCWNTASKPITGVQDAARTARYDLLEAACQTHGILDLCLAHHGDDQAETRALRAESGSGALGLAGMSAISERHHIRLLRPLLNFTKAELIDVCNRAGQDFATDPSNAKRHYARGRLRADGFTPPKNSPTQRHEIEQQASRWQARHVTIFPGGDAVLASKGTKSLTALLPEAARLGLGGVIAAIGGLRDFPRSEKLDTLIAAFAREEHDTVRTLGGTQLRPLTDGHIHITREAGRGLPFRQIKTGETSWQWDGRFVISAPACRDLEGCWIGPLGEAGLRLLQQKDGLPFIHKTAKFALQTTPAIRTNADILTPPIWTMATRFAKDPDIQGVFTPKRPLCLPDHSTL